MYQVELSGLEPLTPCLQIAVTGRQWHAELGKELTASGRHAPVSTSSNGTLMAGSCS